MRVYCPKPLDSQQLYPLFLFKFAPERKIEGLFKDNLPPNYFEREVEYTDAPEEADAIILPNNFTFLKDEAQKYIEWYASMGEKLGKPVFVFSCGDHTDALKFDSRVNVFRYSLYRSSANPKDICAPTLTEDLGAQGITLRKKGEQPTISFCGKAGFSSPRELVASWLKKIKYEVVGILRPAARARIRGVFWRIWSIKALKGSSSVKTLFIIRKTFSGAQRTIELDPAQARREFLESLINTDFVLAPKGDGNYSNRFLEALSLGRFPVVVDTDCVFPLEETIDYSKIVVRVPMNKLKKIPRYVRDFHDALTPEEFVARQNLARAIFEKYLRQDSFFASYFSLRQTQK
jgi:hypothetical protein